MRVRLQIGWKPDKSQPKPLARGSGKIDLSKLENTPSGSGGEQSDGGKGQ